MTRKNRITLFLFLTILFLMAAPLTVLYSLGWRFDWKTKKIIQPGIFYFKVWPKSVQIYLNGNLKEKTDAFFDSVLIENLLAKEYDVEIKKDGFQSWKKKLEIKKGQVTEAKNIVLIPINPGFNVMFKGVKDFFFSPDETKVVLKELDNSDSENQRWSLKLVELKRNIKSHLINEKDISKEEVQLVDLEFSSDSKRVLLKLGLKESLTYYIVEIDKSPIILTSLDFLEPGTEKVYFNTGDNKKLLTLNLGEIKEADLTNKEISPPVLKNVAAFFASDRDIYYLDKQGFVSKTDFSFAKEEKLNILPFSLKEETEYKIEASDRYIFLKENNVLYIFDENKKSFQKIFEPVQNFRFSPDSKNVVYFNNHEIWVLFLEKRNDQPQKEAGEQLFISRFSEEINDVFWYTNHYLVFNAGDKIKIAEIDDRDVINIMELSEFKKPKIFWDQNDKKLYVLTEENLHTSEKIAP